MGTPNWRPTFCEVDGEQVDYAWLDDDEGGFSQDAVSKIHRDAKGDGDLT